MRCFAAHSAQLGGRSATRVAGLAPKHASGRIRRALKCQALLGGGSASMMGQRLVVAGRGVAPTIRGAGRRAGRGGKLVVKAM
jgi:hypothetical protein